MQEQKTKSNKKKTKTKQKNVLLTYWVLVIVFTCDIIEFLRNEHTKNIITE